MEAIERLNPSKHKDKFGLQKILLLQLFISPKGGPTF
jgi:hypothetical protein